MQETFVPKQESTREPPNFLPSEPVQIEFKLRGNPFNGDDLEAANCRQLVLDIIATLSSLHWKLHAKVNVRGGADAIYFVYDENHSRPFSDLVRLAFQQSQILSSKR